MKRVNFACVLFLLGVFSCARSVNFEPHDDRYEACGRRAPASFGQIPVAFAGTLHQKADSTEVDGPVNLVVIDGDGHPIRLEFDSLYTVPSPSKERLATYEVIAASREGDCVHVVATRMAEGKIWIERFENLDRTAQPTVPQ
jgi:hypothetical protein